MSPEFKFPGLFYIVVAQGSDLEGQRLTDGDSHVTITPPGAVPDVKQEWQIILNENGNITIKTPGDFVPTPYLTYDGVPKEPTPGDRVVVNKPRDPFNEWHAKLAPGFKTCLRVAGSDLGIAVSPLTIFPPFLHLHLKDQLEWIFVPVRAPEE